MTSTLVQIRFCVENLLHVDSSVLWIVGLNARVNFCITKYHYSTAHSLLGAFFQRHAAFFYCVPRRSQVIMSYDSSMNLTTGYHVGDPISIPALAIEGFYLAHSSSIRNTTTNHHYQPTSMPTILQWSQSVIITTWCHHIPNSQQYQGLVTS